MKAYTLPHWLPAPDYLRYRAAIEHLDRAKESYTTHREKRIAARTIAAVIRFGHSPARHESIERTQARQFLRQAVSDATAFSGVFRQALTLLKKDDPQERQDGLIVLEAAARYDAHNLTIKWRDVVSEIATHTADGADKLALRDYQRLLASRVGIRGKIQSTYMVDCTSDIYEETAHWLLRLMRQRHEQKPRQKISKIFKLLYAVEYQRCTDTCPAIFSNEPAARKTLLQSLRARFAAELEKPRLI